MKSCRERAAVGRGLAANSRLEQPRLDPQKFFMAVELYQVPTKALNQAIKRNREKFPDDFLLVLIAAEAGEVRRLRSQFVTLKGRGQHRKYLPYAFTEHGALMAATVLNSPRAVAMSLVVIRAFIKMREDLAANAAILRRLAEIDKTLLLHDTALRDVYEKLLPLLNPLPEPPKPEVGFHVREDAVPYRVTRKLTRPELEKGRSA